MGSLICGIHHVALKCDGTAEFEKTLHFYQDVLGLEPVRSWGEGENAGAMLSTGDGLLEIFASGRKLPQGAIRHFALRTERVDDCVAAVRAAGYPITVEPKDIVIASNPPFPARIAFCTGPVGEEIEFFQERAL
ncbi:MAG: VOC family protein [Oscillospiraceae bacterium]|nr:VOC family protein [Oscillospiraceae bacterium]